ncbi:HEAT repeat domain-containing protein [Deferrisoma palaeochoriense]
MDDLIHRPLGDLLEEILDRGPGAFHRYAGPVGTAPLRYRLAVLLGGLCLGPELGEALHEWVARPDSADKRALMLGLGFLGHPLAEGYLARLCRERGALDAAAAAVRALGRIRGPKAFPLVVAALEHPFLRAAACEALVHYGGDEAVAALLPLAEDPAAFRALAELGAAGARDLFLTRLAEDSPVGAWAAAGVGRLGDPDLARELLPWIGCGDPEKARAAFEAYAALGAPEGLGPLFEAAGPRPEPWTLEALGRLSHPEAQEFVARVLDPEESGGWLRRLFRRKARPLDPVPAYRALRAATAPGALERLALRIASETGTGLRELLLVRAFREDPRYAAELEAVWHRGELLPAYLAARCLLQVPTTEFLAEAVGELSRTGLVEADGLPPGADPERLLERTAAEANPVVNVASFLDEGFVDLDALEAELRHRFAAGAYPPAEAPASRLGGAVDAGLGRYLSALAGAHPARREGLHRLWNLLLQLEDRGDPLLELFLCWEGRHRGGLHRALFHGLPTALGRWIQGKTDRNLPEVDEIEARLPAEGPLVGPVRHMLERARSALKAECRDMVLLVEGQVRGDMVLIEAL